MIDVLAYGRRMMADAEWRLYRQTYGLCEEESSWARALLPSDSVGVYERAGRRKRGRAWSAQKGRAPGLTALHDYVSFSGDRVDSSSCATRGSVVTVDGDTRAAAVPVVGEIWSSAGDAIVVLSSVSVLVSGEASVTQPLLLLRHSPSTGLTVFSAGDSTPDLTSA